MLDLFYQHVICQGYAESDQIVAPSTDTGANAGGSTSEATAERGEDHEGNNHGAKAIAGAL